MMDLSELSLGSLKETRRECEENIRLAKLKLQEAFDNEFFYEVSTLGHEYLLLKEKLQSVNDQIERMIRCITLLCL